jgi:hypothetical protein
MINGEGVVVEYKGYLLLQRDYSGTATDSIRRPDGTWRYSPPTFVCGGWQRWVVARRSSGEVVQELQEVRNIEEGRRWVDQQLQRPQQ